MFFCRHATYCTRHLFIYFAWRYSKFMSSVVNEAALYLWRNGFDLGMLAQANEVWVRTKVALRCRHFLSHAQLMMCTLGLGDSKLKFVFLRPSYNLGSEWNSELLVWWDYCPSQQPWCLAGMVTEARTLLQPWCPAGMITKGRTLLQPWWPAGMITEGRTLLQHLL